MPEISLLEPYVLNDVVRKLDAPETMVLLNRFPRNQTDQQVMRWDVERGTRMVAKPNVPNAEAHIVPRSGFTQNSAELIYLREKKVFQATTLRWLRNPGTNNYRRAEEAVARELRNLNTRLDNFAELALWGALKGRLIMDYPDVNVDVDYKMAASHKVTPAVSWATATPAQIIADLEAWMQIIRRDSRVEAREIFTTRDVMQRVYARFADTGNAGGMLMSDEMRNQYYRTGALPGFLGLNWQMVDSTYEETEGTFTSFIPKFGLFMGNYDDGNPIELVEGPSNDEQASQDHIGKFTKVWSVEDPSGRQALMEWNIVPVVYRPEQMIYAEAVVF